MLSGGTNKIARNAADNSKAMSSWHEPSKALKPEPKIVKKSQNSFLLKETKCVPTSQEKKPANTKEVDATQQAEERTKLADTREAKGNLTPQSKKPMTTGGANAAPLVEGRTKDATPNMREGIKGKRPIHQNKMDNLGGLIFMCNAKTRPDCFRYMVMGLPAGRQGLVMCIKPGMDLFLFDFSSRHLHGIFKASSAGGMKLEPAAFSGFFPAQVRFTVHKDCLPIPESVFKNAVIENYNGGSHMFNIELTVQQVRRLYELFPLNPQALLNALPANQTPPIIPCSLPMQMPMIPAQNLLEVFTQLQSNLHPQIQNVGRVSTAVNPLMPTIPMPMPAELSSLIPHLQPILQPLMQDPTLAPLISPLLVPALTQKLTELLFPTQQLPSNGHSMPMPAELPSLIPQLQSFVQTLLQKPMVVPSIPPSPVPASTQKPNELLFPTQQLPSNGHPLTQSTAQPPIFPRPLPAAEVPNNRMEAPSEAHKETLCREPYSVEKVRRFYNTAEQFPLHSASAHQELTPMQIDAMSLKREGISCSQFGCGQESAAFASTSAPSLDSLQTNVLVHHASRAGDPAISAQHAVSLGDLNSSGTQPFVPFKTTYPAEPLSQNYVQQATQPSTRPPAAHQVTDQMLATHLDHLYGVPARAATQQERLDRTKVDNLVTAHPLDTASSVQHALSLGDLTSSGTQPFVPFKTAYPAEPLSWNCVQLASQRATRPPAAHQVTDRLLATHLDQLYGVPVRAGTQQERLDKYKADKVVTTHPADSANMLPDYSKRQHSDVSSRYSFAGLLHSHR